MNPYPGSHLLYVNLNPKDFVTTTLRIRTIPTARTLFSYSPRITKFQNMSSAAMPSALPLEAQTEPSTTEGPSGTQTTNDIPTLNAGNLLATKATVNKTKMAYKRVARLVVQRKELNFYLETFRIWHGRTSRIVEDIEQYGLTEATCNIDDDALVAAEIADAQELRIMEAKMRVRYNLMMLREKWVKDFGPDQFRYWPSVRTPGANYESLWSKIHSAMWNDAMRAMRNEYAHNSRIVGEDSNFEYLHKKFIVLNPALRALTEKLRDALEDQDNWIEDGKQTLEPLKFSGPGYAKDTPETEAFWAEEMVRNAERAAEILQQQEGHWDFMTRESEEAEFPVEEEDNTFRDQAQDEDLKEIDDNRPPKSRGCMNLTLGTVMEFAFKAKFIRRFANAVGQQLWEMQGDLDPSEWIATGVHYHQAPDHAPEWDDVPDDGKVWPKSGNAPAAEVADSQTTPAFTTPAGEGGWSTEAGW